MKNAAASVRARLANQARASQRPFQELVQHYGLERFLYRLSLSPHRDRFVLKGALMLRVWNSPEARPTRDIDLLGFVSNELDTLGSIVREVCRRGAPDDGVVFDETTVATERIKEGADYAGVRVKFIGRLGTARIPMQVDIGFGDVMHPGSEESDYPTLLDYPAPRLRTYPRETVIAEKFHAMVYLATLNSRMKDFFDIWLLSKQFDFEGARLAEAIAKTFAHRSTPLNADPVCLTEGFMAAEAAEKQWAAFSRRLGVASVPPHLDDLRQPLRRFLLPVASALVAQREIAARWMAPGPWR